MNDENTSMAGTLALLDQLKENMPELWGRAKVVGTWVWLEFSMPPLPPIRARLKQLGFHYNPERRSWQHPCGVDRPRLDVDPRTVYPVIPAPAFQAREMVAQPKVTTSKEFKVVALRECPLPQHLQICDSPERAADYWRLNVATNPYYNPECECLVALMLNTRRRVKGHQLISFGILDTVLIHPREVFRGAVVIAAAAIIVLHNLCAATHKLCYVEFGLMWSARAKVMFRGCAVAVSRSWRFT